MSAVSGRVPCTRPAISARIGDRHLLERGSRRRVSWLPLSASLVLALALVAGSLHGVVPHQGRLAPGELLGPGAGHLQIQNTADSLGTFGQFKPGETWNGGTLVEHCAPCNVRSVSGAPAGQSIQPGQEVNPATGDFNFTRQLSSVPTVGGNLGMTVSYDVNRSFASVNPAGPIFGQGWQSSLFPTFSMANYCGTSNGDVTVNEENGSQATFCANSFSASATCPTTDYGNSFEQKYTVAFFAGNTTNMYYCAPYRVDAQLGLLTTPGWIVFYAQGGKSAELFDLNTGLPLMKGNIDIPGLISYLYNGTPGAGGCPSANGSAFGTVKSCDTVQDSAGRQDIVALGAPPNYGSATNLVLQVNDPLGYIFGWSWTPNFSIAQPSSIVMDDLIPPFLVSSWSFGYDQTQQVEMTSITNPDNNTQHITYYTGSVNNNFVSSITDFANAHSTTYSYASNCGLCLAPSQTQTTTVTYSDGEIDTDYYNQGLLDQNTYGTGTQAPSLSTVGYSYTYPPTNNQNGPISETIYVANNLFLINPTWNLTTDGVGNVTTLTDPTGNNFSAAYNDSGSNNFDELCWRASVAVSNPNCLNPPSSSDTTAVFSYTYNPADGELLTSTDANGNTTRFGYYNDEALCWVAVPTVTGTANQCTVPYLVPDGAPAGARAYSYDTQGDLTNTYEAWNTSSQTTATSSYDNDGEMVSSYPPDAYAQGQTPGTPNTAYQTTFSYKDLRLQSKTTPLSRSTSYGYDPLGNTITTTDPTGVTTDNYDTDNRLCWSFRGTNVVYPLPDCAHAPAHSTGYYYNYDTSAVASTTNPDGDTTSYSYNDRAYPNLPTKVIDPMSAAVVYNNYDMSGNLCLTGPVASFSCSWTQGDTYKAYDGLGNLISNEDPVGNTTTFAYGDNRVPTKKTQVTYPTIPPASSGNYVTYKYDANGQLNFESNDTSGGTIKSFYQIGYDTDGRPCYVNVILSSPTCTSVTNTPGNTIYTYDARGNLLDMYDYTGFVFPPYLLSNFGYDNNNTLTGENEQGSSPIAYTYDPAGDVACVGYPAGPNENCNAAASTSNTVVNFGYDSAGRLSSTTDWLSSTIKYDYTADGLSNLKKITYPSGTGESISYGYDPSNLLKTADYSGPAVGSATQSWTPNADSLVSSTSQLGSYNSNPTYDGSHNWVQTNTNPGQTSADTYVYNQNGELASDQLGTSNTGYNYNTADQLTSTSVNGSVTNSYASNTSGERCWQVAANVASPSCASPPTGATSYAWTPFGQLCWSGVTTSTNGCSSAPSGVTTYTYDGRGHRMSETTPTVSRGFAWDDVTGGSVPRLLIDGTHAYIYGPKLFGGSAPIEQIALSNNAPTYLSSVPSGVQLVFNSAGTLLNRSSYDTWGNQVNTVGSKSAFGFEGGYKDPSGLIFLVDRYYDPKTAQFVSIDPMVKTTGQPYAYAGDNPLNASDPSGAFYVCDQCNNPNPAGGPNGGPLPPSSPDPVASYLTSLANEATFLTTAAYLTAVANEATYLTSLANQAEFLTALAQAGPISALSIPAQNAILSSPSAIQAVAVAAGISISQTRQLLSGGILVYGAGVHTLQDVGVLPENPKVEVPSPSDIEPYPGVTRTDVGSTGIIDKGGTEFEATITLWYVEDPPWFGVTGG